MGGGVEEVAKPSMMRLGFFPIFRTERCMMGGAVILTIAVSMGYLTLITFGS